MNAEIDIRDVLPSIRVPTLVLHRTGDRLLRVEEGRYLASRIPGATFVELPGNDHLPFVGDQEALLGPIEQFLSQRRAASDVGHVLASVLTVRLVAAPGDADPVVRIFEREVASARGRLLHAADGRWLAAFDGPGRAVQCGVAVVGRARELGIEASGGVHVGECAVGAMAGPPVEGSAALADAARPGEVYVSRTVVDLVPGSGLRFEERGSLAGPRPVRGLPLFAVAPEAVAGLP
jgi:hypothetical protein